jgi:hypothetical protein
VPEDIKKINIFCNKVTVVITQIIYLAFCLARIKKMNRSKVSKAIPVACRGGT